MSEQERMEAFQVEFAALLEKYGAEVHAVLTPRTTDVQGNEITLKLVPEIQIKMSPRVEVS